MVKNPPANAGDRGLIPRWQRSPEGRNDNPLQYFFFFNNIYFLKVNMCIIGNQKAQEAKNEVIQNHKQFHSSILAWRIPWTEEPGGLQSRQSQTVRCNWATEHAHTSSLPQGKKGMTEDKMVRWHHQLNRHECEQALGDGEGQGSLACCSPWGCKESDMTD